MKKLCPIFYLIVALCGLAFFFSGQTVSSSSHISQKNICQLEKAVEEPSSELLSCSARSALYDLFFVPSKPVLRAFTQKKPQMELMWLTALYLASAEMERFVADQICSHIEIRFILHETILSDVIPARAGPMSV